MSHVICVANFEEQSGKTSAVVNFASSLAVLEKKTLVVDCDPKGEASEYLVADKDSTAFGLFDVLTGIVGGKSAVTETRLPFLDIIPAGDGLDIVDKSLSVNPEKEKILSIIIQKFKDHYDYIVFDTPSEKGLLSESAVMASDSLLIPVNDHSNGVHCVYDVLAYSGKLRPVSDNPLKLSGIFFNRCNENESIDSNNGSSRFRDMKNALLPVTIPVIQTTIDPCRPACLSDIKSPYAEAFLDLCYEFLYRERN